MCEGGWLFHFKKDVFFFRFLSMFKLYKECLKFSMSLRFLFIVLIVSKLIQNNLSFNYAFSVESIIIDSFTVITLLEFVVTLKDIYLKHLMYFY